MQLIPKPLVIMQSVHETCTDCMITEVGWVSAAEQPRTSVGEDRYPHAMPAAATTVEDYLAGFDEPVQVLLRQVREAILRGMPGSTEKIRYGMPAVMLEGRYGLHFAGWKSHVGLYPVPVLDGDLELEVAPYRSTKDTVKFRYVKPIPYDLIERLAREIASRSLG